MSRKIHLNNNNNNSAENDLFLDELVQDFDISLSGFGCDNTNGSLIRDLNQVISTLGDNIVKVEAIDNEDNAQDSADAKVKYYRKTPESPQSNDNSCGSYTSSDSDKKLAKSLTDLSHPFKPNGITPERKTTKRLCFKGFSSDDLSPISSVSSSAESPTHKFVSDNSQSNETIANTSRNTDNSYGYSWRRYSKTDAPSVHNKMSSVQIGQTIKAEPQSRLFQYILGAPTASGVKLGAMTMTYLNQGQPYEIRLKKKISDIPNNDGKNLKTSIRLGFVEKRLQYRETEEMANWCRMHSKDRILEVDFALSYGIFDVHINSPNINQLDFIWSPSREASIFIKLNCISTEFTSKRHGGERGTPLRLIVETNSSLTNAKLDSAQCLVKVFKSKGADRKHKTDRERIAKQPDSTLYYQPSYDCTLLTSFNEDDILVRSSSPGVEDCPSPNISSSHPPSDSPHPTVQLNVATSSTTCYQSPQSTQPSEERPSTPSMLGPNSLTLSSDASPVETYDWLTKNRFSKLTDVLMNFSSEDLRRLSREDLIQICGLSDGIRLYNSIHTIQSTTRLTIFVTTDGKVHNAIYLKVLTHEEVKERLVETLGIVGINVRHFYLKGPNDIKIKLTNDVVLNMKNESIFTCSLVKDSEEYDLILQSAF